MLIRKEKEKTAIAGIPVSPVIDRATKPVSAMRYVNKERAPDTFM